MGNSSRIVSTSPIGGGISSRQTVTSAGVVDFAGTDVSVTFPASGTYPDGEVVMTRLNVNPDSVSYLNHIPAGHYWIFNNYGTNSTFSPVDNITFSNLNGVFQSPNSYGLNRRSDNEHINNWMVPFQASASTISSLTFGAGNTINGASQFGLSGLLCPPTLTLIGINTGDQSNSMNIMDNESAGTITSTQLLNSSNTIIYDSGLEIILNNNFEILTPDPLPGNGILFQSFIDGCGGSQ